MSYYEHHKRSIAKTLGFQALIILADIVVIYFITHKSTTTLEIIVFSNIVSAIIYFIHERTWNRVHWGRSKIEIELLQK